MTDTPKRRGLEMSEEQAFQESLLLLGRTTAWSKWNAVAAIILVIAVSVVLAVSRSLGASSLPPQLDPEFLVGGLLAFMLLSSVHIFYRQAQLQGVQNRLAEQMDAAVRQRERADKFYGLAILDPLTGLYNRRFGEERLKEEILRAEKNTDPLAILLMDLDYFKEINDQYGHAAGDLVLREFSRRLKRAIRACDVPVRMGGDEFLVVLPECARDKVNLILNRLGSFEVRVNRQKVPVSCSIGRAHYQVCDTPETILRRADEVLYAAKAGREKTEAHSPETPACGPHSAHSGEVAAHEEEWVLPSLLSQSLPSDPEVAKHSAAKTPSSRRSSSKDAESDLSSSTAKSSC